MKKLIFPLIALALVGGVIVAVFYYAEPQPNDTGYSDAPYHDALGEAIASQSHPHSMYHSEGRKKLGTLTGEDLFRMPAYTTGEVISHANLAIVLINARPDLNDKPYMTLSEALVRKMATVHETSQVDELNITNLSDQYLFVHSGDIVKGGKQDRTIQYDVVIAPNDPSEAIASYCVESGRWTHRGNESATQFGWCSQMVSSRELKIAARYSREQGEVWGQVSKQQQGLNMNMASTYRVSNADVTRNTSASSLQLTLENEDLDSLRNHFHEKLAIDLGLHPGAVGFAYFINGELYGVDVYNNRQLFADLWYKLLEACIVEAISTPVKENAAQTNVQAIGLMVNDHYRTYSPERINEVTLCTVSENDNGHIAAFLTEDTKRNEWIHRCWLPLQP